MSFDIKRVLHKEINIGLQERKLRYGVGSGLLVASVFVFPVPFLLVGGVLVATAFTRWCPVYSGLSRSSVAPGEPAPSSCCGHGEGHSH